MKRGKASQSHGAGSPIMLFHCSEASSHVRLHVRGLFFFLQSSQVECPEKAVKEESTSLDFLHLKDLTGTYRSEVNLQCLSRLTTWHRWLHGFTTIIVQLLRKKKIFVVVLLEWGFQKYSVMNPFSHDSPSHWLLTNCSEKRKLRVHWGSLNSHAKQTL